MQTLNNHQLWNWKHKLMRSTKWRSGEELYFRISTSLRLSNVSERLQLRLYTHWHLYLCCSTTSVILLVIGEMYAPRRRRDRRDLMARGASRRKQPRASGVYICSLCFLWRISIDYNCEKYGPEIIFGIVTGHNMFFLLNFTKIIIESGNIICSPIM